MVYVDKLTKCPRTDAATPRWKYIEYARLWADTIEELHQFAGWIKLKRKFFKDQLDFPHYDVTLRIRGAAIAAGARSVERSAAADFFYNNQARRKNAGGN